MIRNRIDAPRMTAFFKEHLVSNIDISAYHDMELDAAQAAADSLADDLAQEFNIDYGWDGDFIHFERTGVDGAIEVSDKRIHIQAKLGLLFSFMQGRIEDEIRSHLERHFNCRFED